MNKTELSANQCNMVYYNLTFNVTLSFVPITKLNLFIKILLQNEFGTVCLLVCKDLAYNIIKSGYFSTLLPILPCAQKFSVLMKITQKPIRKSKVILLTIFKIYLNQ